MSQEQTRRALVNLLAAWYEFKQSHNLEDPKVKCCERTEALFISLELFKEAVATELNKGGKKT